MLILAMAAASAVEIPTIFFDKSDRFPNLHCMRLPRVRRFVNVTGVSIDEFALHGMSTFELSDKLRSSKLRLNVITSRVVV